MNRTSYRALISILSAVLMGSFAVSAVSSAAAHPNAGKRLKFAFLVPELADAYWVAGEKGAKAEAAKENIDLKITGTTTFTPSQYNAALQDEISAGVDGILIAPGDPVASNALIKQARAKGIAVATVVVDAPTSARQFFIGPDATLIGQGQGQRVVAYLHGKHAAGQIQMAILSCSPSAISQVLEHKAMVKAVTTGNQYKSQFQVKVVTFLNSTADPTTNLAAYQNLASAYPNLKVVVGECGLDPPSMGLVNKRNHLGWIVGGDSSLPQTLDLVDQGYVTWTMNEEPYETLQWAIQHMADGIRGTKPMPSGVKNIPLTVWVSPKEFSYMKSIHLPAGQLQTTTQGRKSPDAVQ
jgi:simple sugar transport system substrate-binding protein